MQEVVQCTQVDQAQVPYGTASVSVQGSAGTSVSLAAPSLGTTTTRGGGIIVPQCTKHALNTYYATDHLGTVRFTKTIDETGAVTTTTHDYEPFGVEIAPTDECGNTHRFTGHERDAETQNDYMHFRFFSSNMGRFQKPDSVFGSPLNPQGWNLYSYVQGNPVNYNDPTGHMADTGRSLMMAWAEGASLGDTMGGGVGGDDGGGGGGGDPYNINFTQPGPALPAPLNTMHDWILGWTAAYNAQLTQTLIALQGVLAEPPAPVTTLMPGVMLASSTISFSFVKGQPIPAGIAGKCKIIGHGGLWRYRGVEQVGLAWGENDATVEIDVWELRAVTDVFEFQGATGVAIELQLFPSSGEGPLYYERPGATPHENLNPYSVPALGLGKERDLGSLLPPDSVFYEWRQ